jgi:hypothetical protein
LILLGMMALISGCPQTGSSDTDHSDKMVSLAIPSKDAAVPSSFETASFGLG